MRTRITGAWERFWFGAVAPHPMAAFRIALGLYLVCYWAALWPHVEIYFSSEGVQAPYLIGDIAPAPWLARTLFVATWLLMVSFTLGAWMRPVSGLLLASYLYHYFLQLAVKHSSFDRLIVIYLLVACLSDCDRKWSWRTLRHPEQTAGSVVAWPQRVLQFQTVALYLGSGLWKLAIPAWRDGSLLWATLQGLWATPLAFELARRVPDAAGWMWLSWTVIAGEIALGLLLVAERTRNLACVLGGLFHLANCVILVVPEFLVAVVPYTLFVRAASARRVLAWWQRGLRAVTRR